MSRRRPRVQRTVTEDRGRGGHGLDAEYYVTLARSGLMSVPYVGGALRRLGFRPGLVRLDTSILPRALDRVDPDHPDLNADGVRALRRDEAARDPVRSVARELLFYWQVWRWTMDGSFGRAIRSCSLCRGRSGPRWSGPGSRSGGRRAPAPGLSLCSHGVTARYLGSCRHSLPEPAQLEDPGAPGVARDPTGGERDLLAIRPQRLVFLRARRRRARLRNTLFVGVTGSTGKSTTTDLVAAVLSRCGPGKSTLLNLNRPYYVAQTVLSSRSADRFCVVEISADDGPGSLDLPIRLVEPTIGVVTNIGMDHFSLFRSLDATAAEKGKLITALPTAGTAILNADDPRVAAMAGQCRGRVITYGLVPEAMVRAERVQSHWPDHLSFVAVHQGETVAVETRLHGVHWVSCVLAALATGLAVGLPLAEAARAIADVEPMAGRLSTTVHPDGVAFLRDDMKAPLWSVAPALGVIRDARASRKVVVIGTLSDYPGDTTRHYRRVAHQALEVADLVVFVGPWALAGLVAKRHPTDEAIKAFARIEDAAAFLHHELRAGDLVLLKGSNTRRSPRPDHARPGTDRPLLGVRLREVHLLRDL